MSEQADRKQTFLNGISRGLQAPIPVLAPEQRRGYEKQLVGELVEAELGEEASVAELVAMFEACMVLWYDEYGKSLKMLLEGKSPYQEELEGMGVLVASAEQRRNGVEEEK